LTAATGYRLTSTGGARPADASALRRTVDSSASACDLLRGRRAAGGGGGTAMQRDHDLGGRDAGAIVRAEHDYALWEKRVDALLALLAARKLITVDELRRNIEELGTDAYHRLTYYERWIHSITQTLLQRGVINVDELGRRMAEVERRAPGAVP
jgi:hypothetical protein